MSSGGSTAPSAKPRPRRSAESGGWLVARRSGARPGRGTTWRSRSVAAASRAATPGGRHTHDSGERSSRAGSRAPTTTVCAWTAVATSRTDAAMSSPITAWYVAPASSAAVRTRSEPPLSDPGDSCERPEETWTACNAVPGIPAVSVAARSSR